MDDPLVIHDSRPSRADAVKNRELLLRAASRLFAMHGIDEVTMSAVAEEAGVGKGTLYRHFANKTELCLALLDHQQRELQANTLSQLRQDLPPVEKLLWFLENTLSFVVKNLGLMPIGMPGQGLPTLNHAAHLWWRQTIRGLLSQCHLTQIDLDYATDTLYVMLDPNVVDYQVRVRGLQQDQLWAGLRALLACITCTA